MPTNTFIPSPNKAFSSMVEDEESPCLKTVTKVMVENFIFMSMLTSGFGFTLSSIGVLSGQPNIYTYTVAFSFFWGLVGAAAAWSRSKEKIATPQLFKQLLSILGAETQTDNAFFESLRGLREQFSARIFIPFVHSPELV